MYPFGNTEEELRLENLGAAERGHPTDTPFDHTTGKGYVKHKKGIYYDALFIKKNKLEMLIHETSGGFSPPCVARIKRFGRKARTSGDRTHYPTRRSRHQLSYVQFHTQRISSAIVKGEAEGIMTQLTRFNRVAPQAAA